MALEQITFNIGAFNDADASGNNYFAGEIYEVFNANDTLADIFSDAAGLNPIVQNGISNVSDSKGSIVFYIDKGAYYLLSGGERRDFETSISALDLRAENNKYNPPTIQAAIDYDGWDVNGGEVFEVQGYHSIGVGGGKWKTIVAGTTAGVDLPNSSWIRQCVGVPTLAIVLQVGSTSDQYSFGVKGTGYPHNDGAALNAYTSYCRDRGLTLKLSQGLGRSLIYTTEQIDFQGINIEGDLPATIYFGVTPSNLNFNLLSGIPGPRPSASTVYSDEERLPQEGVCIFSDVVGQVVLVSPRFNYSGFGVSGYLGLATQNCIATPFSATYVGAQFNFKDLHVTGAGGDGISLPNGIEVCRWVNVKSSQNNGYGVTTAGGGGDNNQEYFEVHDSEFRLNRLDGFLIDNFKKGVGFFFTNGNSNGWYGLGVHAVGKPAAQENIRGLLRVDGAQTFGATSLIMHRCYSEDGGRLATFLLNNPVSALELSHNYMIPSLGLTDTNNDLFYFNDNGISQLRNLKIVNNTIQDGARGKIFNGDVTESDFVSAEIGYLQTTDYDLSLINNFIANKQTFSKEQTFSNHLRTGNEDIGDGTAGSFNSNFIIDNLRAAGKGNDTHSDGTCYLVTANWQATNAANGGAYLVYAFVLPNGQVKGESLAIGAAVGFSSTPTVALTGVLSVPLSASYRAQITRIDMNGYKA